MSMSNRSNNKKILEDRISCKLFQKMGYRFGKTIGKGTYSRVCIAVNEKGKRYACKIITKKYAGDDFIEKFLPRELDILQSVEHMNIIKVYNIIEIHHSIYVFMDYCKYGDLLEYLKENGPFTEEKTKVLFKQLVDAVYYLHYKDIAHRDIKCENIFLITAMQLKLGDFGFARYCRNKFGISAISNTFCGSTAYAAPEILRGNYYDPKKYDIWALGCVLYVMLTASMPFDDTNVRRMVNDQLSGSIKMVTATWNDCCQHLKFLQNSLLEANTDKRITIEDVVNHEWFKNKNVFKLMSFSESSLL